MKTAQPGVALVAVAKNEAAYIHEWIHHHLYFGFGPIFIGINRTTDHTAEIIEKISAHYPEVHAVDINWIDSARPEGHTINTEIQAIAYAYFWDKVCREFPSSRYLAYLDIDEFWYPRDFTTQIEAYLDALPDFDIVSFYWACQFGERQQFQPPFADLSVRVRAQLKSLMNLKTGKTLKRMRVHTPIFEERDQIRHIDADGQPFVPLMGQKAKAPPGKQLGAGILHRMTRSETEYLAFLKNGNLEHAMPIKDNRDGFWYTSNQTPLVLPGKALEVYHASLARFVLDCDLTTEIKKAQEAISKRAETILAVPRQALLRHLQQFAQVLKGTNAERQLLSKLENFLPFSNDETALIRGQLPTIKVKNPDFSDHLHALMTEIPQ